MDVTSTSGAADIKSASAMDVACDAVWLTVAGLNPP